MTSGSGSESNASSQDTGVVVASPQPITPLQSPSAPPTSQIIPSNPGSPFPLMVIAQHDFPGAGDDEISFRRGEIIVVMAKDDGFGDGWWTGRNTQNQIGLFPAIYTTPYNPPTPSVYDTQPTSPEADTNAPKRTSVSASEGVYEGLGIHSDQIYIDNPVDTPLQEVVRALSIGSGPSSASSDQDVPRDEDDQANAILAQVREWSPQDVAAFLVSRGFKNQASNFIRHEITGEILLELDLAMLKEVDIAAFGVRYNIMREIEGLRRLCQPQKRASQQRDSKGSVRLPLRSPARSYTSGEEDTLPLSVRKTSNRNSPIARYSPGPRPQHYRRSSYEPSTPRSTGSGPRPYSSVHEPPRVSQSGIFDPQRSEKFGHRTTSSQDGGMGGLSSDIRPDSVRHIRSQSSSIVDTQSSLMNGRVRVDSQDSGLGHSRHTSTDTMAMTPPLSKVGHKRQSSSLATVRAQDKSIPLVEAVRTSTIESQKDLAAPPPYTNSTVVLPGTRSETPPSKPLAKFLFTSGGTRSPAPDKDTTTENGVRQIKSYGQLRKRSSSTTSPAPISEETADGESHQHRASLIRNISAKEASATADYSGWLKKRIERGTSIAGLNVGASVGVVGGWKRRWFVLKGRRLSYYHSEKDMKEKGVIDITAHRCVTESRGSNANSPTDHAPSGPARKISLSGAKFIFKIVPPAPGTSRAVTFTPQKVHIFSAENEIDFRGWVEAFMKANIGLDANAPVISSSTVPLISLARAKEMKSRPPALDLSDAHRPSVYVNTSQAVTNIPSDSPNDEDLKSPPLPTPPLAKEKGDVQGDFEAEMEKALGKVGKAENKSPETEKNQPLLELSIPIGL